MYTYLEDVPEFTFLIERSSSRQVLSLEYGPGWIRFESRMPAMKWAYDLLMDRRKRKDRRKRDADPA